MRHSESLGEREAIVESWRDKDKVGMTMKKKCEIRDYPAAFWMKTKKGETT